MQGVSVTPDHERGAGHALLQLDQYSGADRIELAFSNIDEGFLWPSSSSQKIWRNEPHYFAFDRIDGSRPIFRLGPEICDYLAPGSLIDILSRTGPVAQEFIWDGVPISDRGLDAIDVHEPPERGGGRAGGRVSDPEPDRGHGGKEDSSRNTSLQTVLVEPSGERPLRPNRSRHGWWLATALCAGAVALFFWAISNGLDRPMPAQPPGKLIVSALDDPSFSGQKSGPFTPNIVRLKLEAKGQGFSWKISHKPDWLSASAQGGTISDDDSQEIQLTTNSETAKQTVGEFSDALIIGTPSSESTTNVRLTVQAPTPPDDLVISESSELKFSGPKNGPFLPNELDLKIASRGPGFEWSMTGKPDWLYVSNQNGKIPDNGSQDVWLAAGPEAYAKPAGSYSADLIIKTPSATSTQTVRLTVSAN